MLVEDTNITTSGNSIESIQNQLNNDLHSLHRWHNTEKTEDMITGSRKGLCNMDIDPSIRLGNSEMSIVNEIKT